MSTGRWTGHPVLSDKRLRIEPGCTQKFQVSLSAAIDILFSMEAIAAVWVR